MHVWYIKRQYFIEYIFKILYKCFMTNEIKYLYVIGPKEGPQKIGITGDVKQRLKTLQTGFPEPLFLHHYEEIEAKSIRKLEKKIHTELNYKRAKGEWFNITTKEAVEYIIYFRIRYSDDPSLGL